MLTADLQWSAQLGIKWVMVLFLPDSDQSLLVFAIEQMIY